jgi:Na+/melibiose symporter-like transporter
MMDKQKVEVMKWMLVITSITLLATMLCLYCVLLQWWGVPLFFGVCVLVVVVGKLLEWLVHRFWGRGHCDLSDVDDRGRQ